MGQRRQKIGLSKIRMLSGLQCSDVEAAAALEISVKTFREMIRIDVRAREAWEQGRERGRVRIRKAQFAIAEGGRAGASQMAIFLGKQYLGQTEVQRLEHSGPDGAPIQTLDLSKLDLD